MTKIYSKQIDILASQHIGKRLLAPKILIQMSAKLLTRFTGIALQMFTMSAAPFQPLRKLLLSLVCL